MEAELLQRPDTKLAVAKEEVQPPVAEYEDPMVEIEETAEDFLAASRAALEDIAEIVEAAEPVEAVKAAEPAEVVRQELNPLHVAPTAEQREPETPQPAVVPPATKVDGHARIKEIGKKLQLEGKLPTLGKGAVVMKEADPAPVQSTKPKLKLPGKGGIKLKPVQPVVQPQVASAPASSVQTTSQAAKQPVNEEVPIILNSVKETVPEERVVHGVSATKIMGNSSLPTSLSHPVEHIRQLEIIHEDERLRDARMLEIHRSTAHTSAPTPHIGRIFSDFIGLTKPTKELNTQEVKDKSAHKLNTEQRRDLRVQLSMDDLSLAPVLRQTHQEWVKGTPLQDMRTMGIGPDELIAIGISWSDWVQKQQYGVKELAFMGGSWQHAVRMGFMPEDIVLQRDKCGPNILREYWKVTFEDLEWSLGLTVDEAVGTIKLTTADFAVLGESVSSLIRKGFGAQHAAAMEEPSSSFEMALSATDQDLRLLFATPEAEPEQARAAAHKANALQEVHVRTGKPSRPTLKRPSAREFKF